MKRVFSGVQPTGNIHIGNYLGAMKQFVSLQNDMDCTYCIVDLHSITLPQNPVELRTSSLDVAALYLAIGIDPKKSIIFIQSDVPYHTELAWMLMCNTYLGELNRMTQYKEKSKGKDSASAGLFTYPVLMAADILLYDTDVVPVGHDQKQHLELTRDIAIRINSRFPGTFIVPEYRGMKVGARVMSLDDPTSKMSKSNENIYSRISLLDSYDKIKKSIMKSTTDSEGIIKFNKDEKPGISNLLSIYSAFSGKEIPLIEKNYEGQGYGVFKKDLVEVVYEGVKPIQDKFHEIRNSDELKNVLTDGKERACERAQITVKRVKEKFGLGF
ncbi:MAG: tryptophan--tRNA ligase [Eubacteriales bacterium]